MAFVSITTMAYRKLCQLLASILPEHLLPFHLPSVPIAPVTTCSAQAVAAASAGTKVQILAIPGLSGEYSCTSGLAFHI